jgi:hypothetical protein
VAPLDSIVSLYLLLCRMLDMDFGEYPFHTLR